MAERWSLTLWVHLPLSQLEASVDLLGAAPRSGKVWEHRGDGRKGICWSRGKERQRPCWVAVGVGQPRLSQWAREQVPGRPVRARLPHAARDCDSGARREMSRSLYFPSDLGVALNRSPCLHQGKRDGIEATEQQAGERPLQGR